MKKAQQIIMVFAMVLFTVQTTNAQKVKLISGKLNVLKGQSDLLMEYDYSDMAVGKYKKEADYIAKVYVLANKQQEE